jgi:hypothetical protein
MSVVNIELLASAARGSDGQGAAKEVPTITMATVSLRVTAKSGTTPLLDVQLEGSDDDEVTWQTIPVDLTLETATTPPTVATNQRNVHGAQISDATGTWVGVIKHLTHKKVRAAYQISGGTPSYTFAMRLSGK